MEQKDHILRLARGAVESQVSLKRFTFWLKRYVDDESLLDRQPLCGWWQLGGPTPQELAGGDYPSETPRQLTVTEYQAACMSGAAWIGAEIVEAEEE